MAISTPPQSQMNNEISLLEIIQIFRANLKRLILFSILGVILSGLYGQLLNFNYVGSMLVSPPRFGGG